jgi:hypothetical protein
MKKTLISVGLLVVSWSARAQDQANVIQLPGGQLVDRLFVNQLVLLLTLYLIVNFILALLKSRQDYRLRSKLIDRGVPQTVVEQFLRPDQGDYRNQPLKFCLILSGIGVGLLICSFTLPIGIHSFATMAFSLALSFGAYYYFLNKSTH